MFSFKMLGSALGSRTLKCLILNGGNKDRATAFYFTAEMKSVASWLCARHDKLGKWGINTGKSSKLYKIKMSEIS